MTCRSTSEAPRRHTPHVGSSSSISRTLPTSLLNALVSGSRPPRSSVRGTSWRSEEWQERERTTDAAKHSQVRGRNQRHRPLLAIVDCRLPAAKVRTWKFESRNWSLWPGMAPLRSSNFRFRVQTANQEAVNQETGELSVRSRYLAPNAGAGTESSASRRSITGPSPRNIRWTVALP